MHSKKTKKVKEDLRGASKHVVASRSICLILGRCVIFLCPWLPSMPVWLLVFHIYAVPTPRLVCFESSLCRFGCQFLSGLSLSRVLCESLCNPDDNIHLMISQLNYVSCAVSVSLSSCGHACMAIWLNRARMAVACRLQSDSNFTHSNSCFGFFVLCLIAVQ